MSLRSHLRHTRATKAFRFSPMAAHGGSIFFRSPLRGKRETGFARRARRRWRTYWTRARWHRLAVKYPELLPENGNIYRMASSMTAMGEFLVPLSQQTLREVLRNFILLEQYPPPGNRDWRQEKGYIASHAHVLRGWSRLPAQWRTPKNVCVGG